MSREQQSARPLTEMKHTVAVAPPSGAAPARHHSKNKKKLDYQLYWILACVERHFCAYDLQQLLP